MNRVYSTEQIRLYEQAEMNAGVTEDELIERAATAARKEIIENEKFERAVILAGGGNNGSDALSLAMLLFNSGKKVDVYMTSMRLNEYVQKRIKKLRDTYDYAVKDISSKGYPTVGEKDIIIDGMLGIGCNRPLEGQLRLITEYINGLTNKVIALDMPTGLNSDSGEVISVAVKADKTITFSGYKQGLLLRSGRNYVGEIKVLDIGIRMGESVAKVTTLSQVKPQKRAIVSHKGTYGNVYIIAGSPTMMGASLLAHESAQAALRSGAGYAVLCVPESLQAVYQTRVKEELLYFMPDAEGRTKYSEESLDDIMQKAKSIVIGMGMGKNPELGKIIGYLAKNFSGALVIDGDGINAVAEDVSVIMNHKCDIIFTPHVKEFERLEKGACGEAIPKTDTERTKELAKKLNAVIAMKSATTVISDGEEVWINLTGTPAMAKSGSGDVLGGMTGAFAANMKPLEAVKNSCYWFGKAGEKAAEERGEYSTLASDIILKI